MFLKLRVPEKQDESYKPIRNQLRSLINDYEQKNWADENSVTDQQVKENDLAEALVQAENEFYQKRKKMIKS